MAAKKWSEIIQHKGTTKLAGSANIWNAMEMH